MAVMIPNSGHTFGLHDAGQDYVHLERAILVKNPIEAIVVIANGCNPREHQLSRTPGFVMSGIEIVVFPQNTAITFVESYGPRHRTGGPFFVGQQPIKHHGIGWSILAWR